MAPPVPKGPHIQIQTRVEQAHELLQDLSQVQERNRQKRTDIDFSATERETRKLLVAKNLFKKVDSRTLFRHLDFTLSPGHESA